MNLTQFGIEDWIHQHRTEPTKTSNSLTFDEYKADTLQAACRRIYKQQIRQQMESNPSQFWPLSLNHQLSYLDLFPKELILNENDFPLSLEQLKYIAHSPTEKQSQDSEKLPDFIAFDGSKSMLSKNAFIASYQWYRANKKQDPSLEDFCLIDSQSEYHKKANRTFFAPSILIEMAGKIEDLPHLKSDRAEVYEKLISFLSELEIGKLIDLIAANHSSKLQEAFPSAWPLLQELLPMEKGNSCFTKKITIPQLVQQWLHRDSCISLVEKLQRLTNDYSSDYSEDALFKSLKIENTYLRYLSSDANSEKKSWEITVSHNLSTLLKLNGAPIHSVIFDSCSFTDEHLKAIAGPHLKHVTLLGHANPSPKALELLKGLPITKLTLSGEHVDKWLEYISPSVDCLELYAIEVSRSTMQKIVKVPVETLSFDTCQIRRVNLDYLTTAEKLKNLHLNQIHISTTQLSNLKKNGVEIQGEWLGPNDSFLDPYIYAVDRLITRQKNLLSTYSSKFSWPYLTY